MSSLDTQQLSARMGDRLQGQPACPTGAAQMALAGPWAVGERRRAWRQHWGGQPRVDGGAYLAERSIARILLILAVRVEESEHELGEWQ